MMERKKELKQKYKDMKPEMGVFIIKNNLSGRIIIDTSLMLCLDKLSEDENLLLY
jgi:hypothetical protein